MRFVGAAALVGAVVVVIVGSTRRPTPPAEGGPILPAGGTAALTTRPATSPDRLRLASLNIDSGIGRDQRRDLGRTAALLNGYDLICLNEVPGYGPWWPNVADDLGARVGMKALFAPNERRWFHDSFGNALLTARPIEHWRRTPMPSQHGKAYRGVLRLDVPFGRSTLTVLMTHVGTHVDNLPQMEIVERMFQEAPGPVVLMGDMNARADNPVLRRLVEHDGAYDPLLKLRYSRPGNLIDHILVRGVDVTDAGIVENNATDHPLVWAEIQAREGS
jgi:endonuclease/exonuclease/phosphatase family metal-dependent hydrolase